jgi:hypothetical protein
VPKILLWDIETSLQPVAVFQLAHNDWIDPSAILEERYIICASWKWLDEDRVSTVSVLDDPKRYKRNPHDDTHVVTTLRAALAEADVLVHHNGDSFDKRYLDTRILAHGLDPLPPIATIDTYKIAKQKFLFNSNKLDYIGKFLKLGQKLSTTPGLWMRVLHGDRKAVAEMVTYNVQDVRLLEQVYHALKAHMPQHVNRQLYDAHAGCPRCGSPKLQSRGFYRALTKTYRRHQCQACRGWTRSVVPATDMPTVTARPL